MVMLIAFTVLVGVVQSELMCSFSGYKHEAFGEITAPSPAIKLLLLVKHGRIANSACVLSYRVKFNDGMSPYYYFRIDQGGRYSYSMITWDFSSTYKWRESTKDEFDGNLRKCYSNDYGSSHKSLSPQCNRNPVQSKLMCMYNAYDVQTVGEITNGQVRETLQAHIRGIASSDCMFFYQVRDYNRGNLLAPLRIDSGRLTYYGIITRDYPNKVSWNPCTKEEFEQYFKLCDGEMAWRVPRLPPVLSCGRRPNHHVNFEKTCRWSGFDLQPLRSIINPYFHQFIHSTRRGLKDTDCTLSYKVQRNDGSKAFYPFRIDEGRLSHYGIIGVDSRDHFVLKGVTKEEFESYLDECYSGDWQYAGRPQVPPVLQCSTNPSSNLVHLEDMCQKREIVRQSIGKITNQAIKKLLQSKISGLDDSACTLSYRVSDAFSSYYYYRIQQESYYYYYEISVDASNNYRWRQTTEEEFMKYIACNKQKLDELQCKRKPPKMCKHSGFLELTIKQIPDKPIRKLLKQNLGVGSSACTLSYQVRYKGQRTFYPFIVQRQDGRKFYAQINTDYENSFSYRPLTKEGFEEYLTLCDGGVPKVPSELSCVFYPAPFN